MRRDETSKGLLEGLGRLYDEYGQAGVLEVVLGQALDAGLRPGREAEPIDLICAALGVNPANVYGGTIILHQRAVVSATLELMVKPPEPEDDEVAERYVPGPIPGNTPVPRPSPETPVWTARREGEQR